LLGQLGFEYRIEANEDVQSVRQIRNVIMYSVVSAILVALRKAGARIDGGVFQTPRLKVDLTSGGILTYDTHHGVLYALTPQD